MGPQGVCFKAQVSNRWPFVAYKVINTWEIRGSGNDGNEAEPKEYKK